MFNVCIEEISLQTKSLDGFGMDYGRIDGELKKAYFIENDEGSYQNVDKEFLLEFLTHQNRYPLFISYVIFNEDVKNCIAFFGQNKLEFSLNQLNDNREAFFEKHLSYINVTIKDADTLTIVFAAMHYLLSRNVLYAISYSNNLTFELKEIVVWGRKTKFFVPVFKMDSETTFITVYHDGNGFYLFSNEEKYISIDKLILNFPFETIVTEVERSISNKCMTEKDDNE